MLPSSIRDLIVHLLQSESDAFDEWLSSDGQPASWADPWEWEAALNAYQESSECEDGQDRKAREWLVRNTEDHVYCRAWHALHGSDEDREDRKKLADLLLNSKQDVQGLLDALVHDAVSSMASEANNNGLDNQLRFLAGVGLPTQSVLQHVLEAIE